MDLSHSFNQQSSLMDETGIYVGGSTSNYMMNTGKDFSFIRKDIGELKKKMFASNHNKRSEEFLSYLKNASSNVTAFYETKYFNNLEDVQINKKLSPKLAE